MQKRALVTGAAKRLGRSMALYLAQRGFDVAVHYATSKGAAEELVEEIRGMGRKACAIPADLSSEAEVLSLVPAAARELGGAITCLVNNASVFEHDDIRSATRDSWDRHFEINLRAPYVLIQALAEQAPDPLEDGNGEPLAQAQVINLIDQRVRKLTPDFSSYTLSKSALWTLTQTAAQGLAPAVRVNAIGPGPTLQGPRQSRAQFQQQRQATILQRGADPDGITAALGYLLDAPSVTGQMLCVDGGQHLAWETPDASGVE